jgi:hypothetical protein
VGFNIPPLGGASFLNSRFEKAAEKKEEKNDTVKN